MISPNCTFLQSQSSSLKRKEVTYGFKQLSNSCIVLQFCRKVCHEYSSLTSLIDVNFRGTYPFSVLCEGGRHAFLYVALAC